MIGKTKILLTNFFMTLNITKLQVEGDNNAKELYYYSLNNTIKSRSLWFMSEMETISIKNNFK